VYELVLINTDSNMHGDKIKIAPTCFGAFTPSSGGSLFVLVKVTVVKTVN
jgi:hypothetical protein